MKTVTLQVFDSNISESSPAGSCVLKMLKAARALYDLEVFTSRTELTEAAGVSLFKISIPHKPVVAESVLFSVLASLLYLSKRKAGSITISSDGMFPFADVCYSHNSHKLIVTAYRDQMTGGFLTRAARFLNYCWMSLLESVALQSARVIVVPSEGLGRDLVASHGTGIEAKLRVIPNPVDCGWFKPLQVDPSERPFRFVFCALGNFEWKGLGLILQALATGMDAELVVIGGTEMEISRFRGMAGAARVRFVGMQGDIRSYLWAADVFVFPSLHESFGLACFQAAAAGLPLIATDLYALGELLEPGVSGWRVERTVESISRAMREAMADPIKTRGMGLNAQARAQNYDLGIFQQRWITLLASLIITEETA